MTQLRKNTEELEVYYHHPSTNEMWKSCFPRATSENRGPKILRTEPVPEKIEDRLDECLINNVEENAIGLGIELSVNPEKWPDILSVIEEKYLSYNRKQLSLFLNYLSIENPRTLFEQIEVNTDFSDKELRKMAQRSKLIRFKRFCIFWQQG